ncbi:MAG: prolyl hydroxylase family protein [Usitatibacter sp.]
MSSASASPRPLDADWLQWVQINVARGCSKEELRGILLSNGFDERSIAEALGNPAAIRPAALVPPPHVKPKLANAHRHDSSKIELYMADDFLDPAECAELVALITAQLRPSTISTPPAGEYDTAFRTSRTCDLSAGNECVARLEAKIAAALGVDLSFAEPTQGQHYEVGQVFKAHTDFFKAYELERFSTDRFGQRTWTFMVYLNEPGGGGETRFPDVDFASTPKRGKALFWNNLLPSGAPNAFTRHESMPVTSGTKTIITKWFRMPRNPGAVAFSSNLVAWTQKT